MKVAAVIYKFFPYGGIQLDLLRIIAECNARGHEVVVYTTKWEGECPNYVELHTIEVETKSNHKRMAEFSDKVNKLLKESPVDVVFGVNRIAGLDAYFAGDTCYTAKAHSSRNFLYRLMPRYKTYHQLEGAVFSPESSCKCLMMLTQDQKLEFMQYFNTPKERFILLPPGIPEDRCRPEDADKIRAAKRAELGLADSDILLIQIGSGFITKGLDRTIKAMASLPSGWKKRCRLLVVGSDRPERFIKLAKRLRVDQQVDFLGGRNDVPALLWAADLLMHPAVNDATATVLAEAIVAGLPAICTSVCGFSTLVKQANSGIILNEPFNQDELNKELEKILDPPERLQIYQDNAIMYANNADFFRRQKVAVDGIENVAKEKIR